MEYVNITGLSIQLQAWKRGIQNESITIKIKSQMIPLPAWHKDPH